MALEIRYFATLLLPTRFNADASSAVILLGLFGAGIALVAEEMSVASSLSISEIGAMFAVVSDPLAGLRFLAQYSFAWWVYHLTFQCWLASQ